MAKKYFVNKELGSLNLELALVIGLLSLAVVFSLASVGDSISNLFNNINVHINGSTAISDSGSITITVTDSDGMPLENISVGALAVGITYNSFFEIALADSYLDVQITDSSGMASFKLPEGEYIFEPINLDEGLEFANVRASVVRDKSIVIDPLVINKVLVKSWQPVHFENFDRANSGDFLNGWSQRVSAAPTYFGIFNGKYRHAFTGTNNAGIWKNSEFSFDRAVEVTSETYFGSMIVRVGSRDISDVTLSNGGYGYQMFVNNVSGVLAIHKVNNGSIVTLGSLSGFSYPPNTVFRIERLSDGTISVYINGVLELSVNDKEYMVPGDEHLYGFGVRTVTTSSPMNDIRLDNMVVYEYK